MGKRLKRSAIKPKLPVVNFNNLKSHSNKLSPYALAYSLAIISGVWMLILSLVGKAGYCLGMIEIMQKMHYMYSLSISGIVVGVAEAAVCGLVFGFVFGWLYNKLV